MLIEGIDPIAFTLGPFEVRWYGVMMAVSFALGFYFLIKNEQKRGINEEQLFPVAIVAMIAGLIGARIIFVLTNSSYFYLNPEEIVRIDHGGLAFYGGVLGGIVGGWFMARWYKLFFPHY